jgi:hypothetical protein
VKPAVANVRTLLLIDDHPVHAKVFQKALLCSPDGPFQGEWITSLDKGLQRFRARVPEPLGDAARGAKPWAKRRQRH